MGAIEQNGDTGATGAYVHNNANLASHFRATNRSELADLETNADRNLVCIQIHDLPRKREWIVWKKGGLCSNIPAAYL
ncbi:rhodanese-related sulfurtransferase [Bradyrhizobium sp. USDA 4474]